MPSFLLVRQRCRRARWLSVVRAVAAGWARLGDKSLFHQWWANANRKRAGRGPHRLSVRRDCWDFGSSLDALLSFPWTRQIQTILRSHALLTGPPRWGIENISAPALVPLVMVWTISTKKPSGLRTILRTESWPGELSNLTGPVSGILIFYVKAH